MNKNVNKLEIPHEDKILISKIEKRIGFLSEKIKDYFDQSIIISSKKINDAYDSNDNLLIILYQKQNLVDELKNGSKEITKKGQLTKTSEFHLQVPKEVESISLIENTLALKEQIVLAKDKMFVLSKKKNYIKNRNNTRKREMEESFKNFKIKIENDKIVNHSLGEEDVKLIKNFIDPKKIKGINFTYIFTFFSMIISIVILGVILWQILA